MKKPAILGLLLTCALTSPAWAKKRVPESYRKLNALLKVVHERYSQKDFAALDQIRPEFIEHFESYESGLHSGKIKNSNKIMRRDYKMAKNYYQSLTRYYSLVKSKYGQKDEETKGELKAPEGSLPNSPETKSEVSPESDTQPVDQSYEETIGELKELSDQKDKDLKETQEEIKKEVEELDKEFQAAIEEDVRDTSVIEEILSNESDELILNEEIEEPFNEKEAEVLLDAYFERKYKKRLAPTVAQQSSRSGVLQTQQKEDAIINDKRASLDQIYQEELTRINEGLKRIKLLKDNQARFEMKLMERSQETSRDEAATEHRTPKNQIKKENNTVFAQDRLSEIEEDVIIISVPKR